MAKAKPKTVKKPVKKLVRKLPPVKVAPIVAKVAPAVVPVKEVVQPAAQPTVDTKKAALLQTILTLKNQKANGHEVRMDQLDQLAAMIEK